jgi:hypothetical protein
MGLGERPGSVAHALGEEGLSQLLIKLRRAVDLRRDVFVVADPELRIVLSEQLGDALDRGQRVLLVEEPGKRTCVLAFA